MVFSTTLNIIVVDLNLVTITVICLGEEYRLISSSQVLYVSHLSLSCLGLAFKHQIAQWESFEEAMSDKHRSST